MGALSLFRSRKPGPRLEILVGPSKERICTADGKRMTVVMARTRVGRKLLHLNDIARFEGLTNVSIVLETTQERSRLELTPKLEGAMVKFLNNYQEECPLEFDCYAFANLVHGQPPHRCTYLLRFWDVESATELLPGGTVFFLDEESSHFFHAAIYLDSGLCVSVYGGGGDLQFSTIEDMQAEFGGTAVMALPRK